MGVSPKRLTTWWTNNTDAEPVLMSNFDINFQFQWEQHTKFMIVPDAHSPREIGVQGFRTCFISVDICVTLKTNKQLFHRTPSNSTVHYVYLDSLLGWYILIILGNGIELINYPVYNFLGYYFWWYLMMAFGYPIWITYSRDMCQFILYSEYVWLLFNS